MLLFSSNYTNYSIAISLFRALILTVRKFLALGSVFLFDLALMRMKFAKDCLIIPII